MSFDDRTRYSFQEAVEFVKECPGWICHILQNGDAANYSVMRHINVEWCDYCDQRNAAYRIGLRYSDEHPLVHAAKSDPYERQDDGVRDHDAPCEDYERGEPSGDCETDGHFMCSECKNKQPQER